MNKTLAKQILLDLHNKLNENGISHFLFFGTLLGSYRNNDFLSDDIDIVCDYKDYWKVKEIFKNDSSWQFNCIWRKEIALWKYNRKIDILFADVEDENTYLYIYKKNNITGKWHTEQRYIWKSEDIFPLKNRIFLGTDFLVPNNPENILTDYYGKDWKIPDPLWNRDRNPTPNLHKNYRQIAVLTDYQDVRNYFEDNYDNDWIKVYTNPIFINEPLVLGVNNLDLSYIYNLQVLIDILNERDEILNITIGILNNPEKTIKTRSTDSYLFEKTNDNGILTLYKNNKFDGYLVKTNLESIIKKKVK